MARRDPDRVPIGIDALDRQLGGGIPPGTLVAYTAPPASQSELLLYELTVARPTLYLTTSRTEDAVHDAFERASCPTGDPQIHHVPSDAPIQHAYQLTHSINSQAYLIIDPIDPLERLERSMYQNFLNNLQTHMINTGSIAVLHCLAGDTEPENRMDTLHMADAVFELTRRVDGADVETRLAVPKFRGGAALAETVKLELTERVRVDTSRDIA